MSWLYGAGTYIQYLIHFLSMFSFRIHIFHIRQKTELIKNIEKLSFWADDNQKLSFAKHELLSQINNLDISISGKGFFIINRSFMAGVSLTYRLDFQLHLHKLFFNFLFQMAVACCTYIVIFIQFYLSNK